MMWSRAKEKEQTVLVVKDEPKAKSLDLAITATSICSATGNTSFALFGAVATNLSVATEDQGLVAPDAAGQGFVPILTVPLPELDQLPASQRMQEMMLRALKDMCGQIDNTILPESLVCVVVPGGECSRASTISEDMWIEKIREIDEELERADIRIIPCTQGVARILLDLAGEMSSGRWKQIFLGSVDSMFDILDQVHLAKEGRLKTADSPDGLVLGEACAFVQLESLESAKNKHEQNILGVIRYADSAPENNAGQADIRQLRGLAHVVKQVTSPYEGNGQVSRIIRSSGAEHRDRLEWYQVSQKIWRQRLPEQQRLAMQLGEIDAPQPVGYPATDELETHIVLGETGIAALMVSLVLAVGWLDFIDSTSAYILVCETGDLPWRGAVIVEGINSVSSLAPVMDSGQESGLLSNY